MGLLDAPRSSALRKPSRAPCDREERANLGNEQFDCPASTFPAIFRPSNPRVIYFSID